MPTTIRIRSCRRLFRFAFIVSSILFRSKGVRRLSSPPIPDRRWLVQSFAGPLRPIGFPPYHTTTGRLLQCKKMQKFRVFPAASSQQGGGWIRKNSRKLIISRAKRSIPIFSLLFPVLPTIRSDAPARRLFHGPDQPPSSRPVYRKRREGNSPVGKASPKRAEQIRRGGFVLTSLNPCAGTPYAATRMHSPEGAVLPLPAAIPVWNFAFPPGMRYNGRCGILCFQY